MAVPALVQAPPTLIDAVNYSAQFGQQINPFGIFQKSASAWYQVLTYSDGTAIGVWLSTNQGTTWTEQDTPNHIPRTANVTGQSVYFNSATGVIQILWQGPGAPGFVLKVTAFDTGTNAYGATSAASPDLQNPSGAAIYQQSGGTIVVAVNVGVGGGNALKQLTLIAGVWAGPTALGVVTDPQLEVRGVAEDSSDRGHLDYNGPGAELWYATISAALVLSAPQQLSVNYSGDITDQKIWGNNIVIAWIETNAGTANILKVAIGTPLAAPVFTTYTVDTVSGASEQFIGPEISFDKDGNLVLFVTDFNIAGDIDRLLKYAFSSATSAWGASVLFYDSVTNPPAGGVSLFDQLVFTGASVQLASGAWVYSTQMGTHGPTGLQSNVATGLILMAPGVPVQVNSGSGGRKIVVLTPNQFDYCLHREYRLFCNIDYDRLGCAKLPKCFAVDEREWGNPV